MLCLTRAATRRHAAPAEVGSAGGRRPQDRPEHRDHGVLPPGLHRPLGASRRSGQDTVGGRCSFVVPAPPTLDSCLCRGTPGTCVCRCTLGVYVVEGVEGGVVFVKETMPRRAAIMERTLEEEDEVGEGDDGACASIVCCVPPPRSSPPPPPPPPRDEHAWRVFRLDCHP
jgi:hypothetical protein